MRSDRHKLDKDSSPTFQGYPRSLHPSLALRLTASSDACDAVDKFCGVVRGHKSFARYHGDVIGASNASWSVGGRMWREDVGGASKPLKASVEVGGRVGPGGSWTHWRQIALHPATETSRSRQRYCVSGFQTSISSSSPLPPPSPSP